MFPTFPPCRGNRNPASALECPRRGCSYCCSRNRRVHWTSRKLPRLRRNETTGLGAILALTVQQKTFLNSFTDTLAGFFNARSLARTDAKFVRQGSPRQARGGNLTPPCPEPRRIKGGQGSPIAKPAVLNSPLSFFEHRKNETRRANCKKLSHRTS